jgi:hypothetical protein
MKMLTEEQADVLRAFLECFEQHTTGVWATIEEHMREDYGIDNPDDALEEVAELLRS